MKQAPTYQIDFTFRGKDRKALVRKYSDTFYSVGFAGDWEITKLFSGLVFVDSGIFLYQKEITVPDKLDFEKAVKDQLR